MSDDTVKGIRRPTSHNTPVNAMSFMMEAMINRVNTALPVRIDGVELSGSRTGPAGYVSCTPLVCQTDADGQALESASLPRLPFFRLQSGKAAILIDPRPGDVGLAVFAQSDASQVPQGEQGPDPVRPGSFRKHDKADGFYVGGFLGQEAETWIELDPDEKTITIQGPEKVTVNTKVAEINAEESFTVNTKQAAINASERLRFRSPDCDWGWDGGGGAARLRMDIVQEGSHISSGDQIAAGVSQVGHTHAGVETGDGNTGGPNAGEGGTI